MREGQQVSTTHWGDWSNKQVCGLLLNILSIVDILHKLIVLSTVFFGTFEYKCNITKYYCTWLFILPWNLNCVCCRIVGNMRSKCGKYRFRASKFKIFRGGMPPDPPRFVSSIYLQQSDFNLDPPLISSKSITIYKHQT